MVRLSRTLFVWTPLLKETAAMCRGVLIVLEPSGQVRKLLFKDA